MYRTLVIILHTFRESAVQPIYALLLALGTAIIFAFRWLPFFTFGEDAIMYKAVGLDIIMLLALLATLFATSRSIYDEIEDRTMLTLMSKPVSKLQVLLGKYIGIILSTLLFITIMGGVLIICTWMRVPGDYQLNTSTVDERELSQIAQYRAWHLAGLIPSLILSWLQVSVLAAIGVALSTRFSLVVNLPVVILLYIAGNLVRFLFPIFDDPNSIFAGSSAIMKWLAYGLSALLPYLESFDLRELTVYRKIAVAGELFSNDPSATPLGVIWKYLGFSTLYAIAYATFALSIGMWMFQNRELGGAEG
jgi:ABC-type transport system involved in multi-copper enzyme maturation permease subunit